MGRKKQIIATFSEYDEKMHSNSEMDDPKLHLNAYVKLTKYLTDEKRMFCESKETNKNVEMKDPKLKLTPFVKLKKKVFFKESNNHFNKEDAKLKLKPVVIVNKHEIDGRRVLREIGKVNYKERESVGTPEVNENTVQEGNTRRPIYRQVFSSEDPAKGRKRRDPFAFIPEPDEKNDSDTSFRINTPIKKRKVVHKIDKAKNLSNAVKIANKNLKKGHEVSYDEKLNKIIGSICKRINGKKLENADSQTLMKKDKNSNDKTEIRNTKVTSMKSIFNSTQIDNIQNVSLPEESLIFITDKNMHISDANSIQRENSKKNRVNSSDSHNISDDLFDISEDVDLIPAESHILCLDEDLNVDNTNTDEKQVSNVKNVEKDRGNVRSDFNNTHDLFGFSEDSDENDSREPPKNKKINIIENRILINSPISNRNAPDDASACNRGSWRFEVNCITRNPHFLNLKKNALPSLTQEPVLDHTFEDHISEVNKTPTIPGTTKSPKQKSILNYIQTNKDHFNENHQNNSHSLYGVEEYSPIKIKDANKENIIETRQKVRRQAIKRNILGEINENITNHTSTPAKHKSSAPIQIDLSLIEKENISPNADDFGFGTCSQIIEEENTEEAGKPFRLDVNPRQQHKTKKLPEKYTRPVRDSEIRRLVKDDSDFRKIVEKDNLECDERGLFEDIEVSVNITKSYKPLTKRKLGFEQHIQKKNHPECKLSREAKKWINEFNKMCDEVDSFELEVE